jgi:hypothetical protein
VRGLKDVRSDRDELALELKSIDTRSAKGLDPFKEHLEGQFEVLDLRVDKLNDEMP